MTNNSFITISLTLLQASDLLLNHPKRADRDGIAILRTEAGPIARQKGRLPVLAHYAGVERPAKLPRRYDIWQPELTFDMADTIARYFATFETGGRLLIESNRLGLWFHTISPRRLFIGLTRLHEPLADMADGPAPGRRSLGEQPCSLH
jgi:hypothetical protein